jgi:hypothetical protein
MKEKFSFAPDNVSKLRIKPVAVFSILFAVTFAIISLASYSVSRLIITNDIDIQTQEVVNCHAAEIDQWITRMLSIISAYSHLVERGIPDDRNITSEILGNYSREAFFLRHLLRFSYRKVYKRKEVDTSSWI